MFIKFYLFKTGMSPIGQKQELFYKTGTNINNWFSYQCKNFKSL